MVDISILQTVADATRLREGPSGVSAMLRAVYRAEPMRLQDAAREVHLPLPVAAAIRRELEKAGLFERNHGISLTEQGREFVETSLGLGTKVDFGCPTCTGRGVVIPPDFHALVEELETILTQAPSVDFTLDQAPCTAETAMLRAILMLQNGALEGRRVLLLGDDDSISLAIGLLSRSLGRPDLTRGVVVVDADDRWLAFLGEVGRREQIAIETVQHDLRNPLPEGLRGSFDVVETDPPYTLEGARLFLGRGAEALQADSAGSCFFSFAHWPASQMLPLQQVFIDHGFAVRAIWPDFNRYMGASVLGNIGQLIELTSAGPMTASMPTWSGPLYTAQVGDRAARIYVCQNCGNATTLGQAGAPETIEALKADGCRVCGARTFRRQSGGTYASA